MEKKVSAFSERLKDALAGSGMTKTELSTRTGISKSSITHYCKGDWEAKQDSVYLLAKALDVSEAWLMGYDVPRARTGPTTPLVNDDPELTEYLETLRTRPEMRMLFSVSKDASREDVEKAVAIIEALRKAEGR